MKPQVFLSYSNRDRKLATAVGRELKKLDVLAFDPETEAKPGVNSRDVIVNGIRKSDFLVVFWTPSAATSDWISYEVGSASALGKSVIVMKPRSLSAGDLPSDLAGWKTIDFDPDSPIKTAKTLISSLAIAG